MIEGKINNLRDKILLIICCFFLLGGVSGAGEDKDEFALLTSQPLELSGYTQAGYTHTDVGINGFRIRRARAGLKGDILKHVNYYFQIDAVKSPVLLDARVEISFTPYAKLAFGQFKVPFSLENLTSSSALDAINRSQTVENLCPGRDIGAQGRDIGVTLSGKFSKIEYNLGVFNGSGTNRTDSNEQKDIAGRLTFYPFSFLTLSLSRYQGKYTRPAGGPPVERNRTGVETVLIKGQLSVKGEYIFATDEVTDRYGWYVQGGYYLVPDKIQAIVKYDYYDVNMDIQGDRTDVITLGLNWFFSKITKLQINYEYHREGLIGSSKNVILVQFQAGF